MLCEMRIRSFLSLVAASAPSPPSPHRVFQPWRRRWERRPSQVVAGNVILLPTFCLCEFSHGGLRSPAVPIAHRQTSFLWPRGKKRRQLGGVALPGGTFPRMVAQCWCWSGLTPSGPGVTGSGGCSRLQGSLVLSLSWCRAGSWSRSWDSSIG